MSPELAYDLYPFRQPDGSFDYAAYVRNQVRANRRKLRRTFVQKDVVQKVVEYLHQYGTHPIFGLCHGTRRGVEQRLFRDLLPDCLVIGTEIAPSASQFPYTIQWDFHEIKPEWVGVTHFIYTNSLDHAYDPERAVTNWMRCLTPSGLCFVEWWGDTSIAIARPRDPFAATLDTLVQLITRWGAGRYAVREVLPLPWMNRKLPRPRSHGGLVILEPTRGA